MDNYLPFVSLDVWTMIFTWVNLVILFLLLKKFLFKPVNKILDERAAEIDNEYKAAEQARSDADSMKSEYETRLSAARNEADEIVKSAVSTANERRDAIVTEANLEAQRLMEKSREQIEADRKNSLMEMKSDIAGLAVDAAEKILKREIDDSADDDIIRDVIDKL